MRTGMLFKKSTTKTGYRKTPCRDALGISCTCCEESATRGTRTGKTRWWWRGWRQGRGRWYDIWPPLTRRRPPRSRWNTWSKSRQWRYSRAERSIGRVQRTERKKRFFHRLIISPCTYISVVFNGPDHWIALKKFKQIIKHYVPVVTVMLRKKNI